MVAPKRHVQTAPTNYWLLLAVKILLVVLILLWLAPVVYGKSTGRKRYHHYRQFQYSGLRRSCQNDGPCSDKPYWESQNCIHQCMSETCFAQIYAGNLLEDGEIDFDRAKDFKDCVMQELAMKSSNTDDEAHADEL